MIDRLLHVGSFPKNPVVFIILKMGVPKMDKSETLTQDECWERRNMSEHRTYHGETGTAASMTTSSNTEREEMKWKGKERKEDKTSAEAGVVPVPNVTILKNEYKQKFVSPLPHCFR